MQVGDPKKAIVLSVIALVVVCAAVYRVLPSAPAPVAKAPDASQTAANAPTLEDEVAESVAIDPFSHPDLAKEDETAPVQRQPDQAAQKPKPTPEISIQQPAPKRGTGFEPLPPVQISGDVGAPKTEAGLEFRVDAVVRGDEAMALVSIAQYSSIAVRPGTVLNRHVKIVEIKSGSVVIEASGKRHEVSVGAGVTL
jgi:hypothetical protein